MENFPVILTRFSVPSIRMFRSLGIGALHTPELGRGDVPTFRTSGTMEKLEIVAIPKRPGLGGFFQDDGGVHYNPRGPASKSDPLVRGQDLPHISLIPR